MSYPPLDFEHQNSNSSLSFNKLHPKVQKWIWNQKWDELRDIQEKAIPLILNCDTDLIISSPTASGKTEAAFLPIFSKIIEKPQNSIQAIYISPLKALINDQFERLYQLSELLEIEIFKWHGDISYHHKKKLLNTPCGILQITPESLESLLINHFTNIKNLFQYLDFVVIDELHYFVATERGKQLQSILYRLEVILKKVIPRIGLSATIGDMNIIEKYLRPKSKFPVSTIVSEGMQLETKLQIKGYLLSKSESTQGSVKKENHDETCTDKICMHILNNLRGKTNLVFANSRANVEKYSDKLLQLTKQNNLPNEFFPHHGSLSKEIREQVEERLKNKNIPTTAICTSTLELGIDVGTVNSIAQIGVSPSVSSIRQRLGRSGRRGEAAILRIYLEEIELDISSNINDKLRTELFHSVAMINLLVKKWYEPQNDNHLHLSTLLHQILAVIAQYGGINTKSLWDILVESGSFSNISKDEFIELLQTMNEGNLINQTSENTIVIGLKGERIVNKYDFYSVFLTPEEYRLIFGKNTLGTLPINFALHLGMLMIFAGKRWEVIDINEEKKIIQLKPSPGGRPPKFIGGGWSVNDIIRQEMFSIYSSSDIPTYLDNTAMKLYMEGLNTFSTFNLTKDLLIQDGKDTIIFVWYGDIVINTLILLLKLKKIPSVQEGVSLRCFSIDIESLKYILLELTEDESNTDMQLASLVKNKIDQKYDRLLSEHLLDREYCSRNIELNKTKDVISQILRSFNK